MAEGEFDPGERIPWAAIRATAEHRFGIRRFRPGQRELIEAVLAGRDAIGILPTGAGKSLCFQLPSLFLRGAVVVVSPLIALMHDQIEHLEAADIEAARLDSTVPTADQEAQELEIAAGAHDIILLTPERLSNPENLRPLQQREVSLLVIDEAHCISQWGHDFRPAYLELRHAIHALGKPAVLALTATAPAQAIEAMRDKLDMSDPVIVQTSIERENLFLEVRRTVNREEKEQALLEMLETEPGSGIVYAATVRCVDELHGWLRQRGQEAERYHGRMSKAARAEAQQRFMSGQRRLMIATNAFGMGVDKPDIRFVVHWNFPGSLESYYQEAGRAGRDGKRARCVLLYKLEDKRIRSFFLGGKAPRRTEAMTLLQTLRRLVEDGERVTMRSLAEASGMTSRRVSALVSSLEDSELIERSGNRVELKGKLTARQLAGLFSGFDAQHRAERDRLQAMIRYCETLNCRMKYLNEYFGEESGDRCSHCDNCERGAAEIHIRPAQPETASAAAPELSVVTFEPGSHVKHRSFGRGEVLSAEDNQIVVAFARHGEKRILASKLRPI